jgi:N6-adenosine-specific RNA methylase IME4
MDLIRTWGFTYKTVGFYWVKLNPNAKSNDAFFTGLGYWTRANPEQCLLATRGSPRRHAQDVKRLVIEPRRQHSRKPDSIRTRIERLLDGPHLEFFAGSTKPGWGAWDAWGAEISLFDNGHAPTAVNPRKPRRAHAA